MTRSGALVVLAGLLAVGLSWPAEAKPERCGHYPRVSLAHDCYIVENQQIAQRWRIKPVAKCIRHYESGHNYRAVSPHGTFKGAYQFTQSTLDSVGPRRLKGVRADRMPPLMQDLHARRLHRLRGLSPWPTPAKRCR